MPFLNNLNWRYAVKKFDTNKSVSEEDLNKILEAIRLAPTSMGLQSFNVLVISDKELKNKLKPIANNQSQIDTCNYLLVFCSDTNLDKNIDNYFDASNKINPISPEKLKELKEARKKYMHSKPVDQLSTWANKQIYILLGFAMAACAELRIDSCPMEGFEKTKMDKALDLPDNLKSQVLLPIGYRKDEPKRKKVRLANDKLFIYI